MKIVVIGYSGCGKSTLAAAFAEKYELPIMYLDKVHWLSGWQEQELSVKEKTVGDFLDSNSEWVIDGTYGRLHFERRMEEADMIVILRFGALTCLWRVIRRYFEYRGKTRASMTEGCDEKIDLEFIKWVVFDGRKRKRKFLFAKVEALYADKTTVLKTPRALNKFYKAQGLTYRKGS